LAELFALTGLVIAQPVLDVTGCSRSAWRH
jgi:hypothetical protein